MPSICAFSVAIGWVFAAPVVHAYRTGSDLPEFAESRDEIVRWRHSSLAYEVTGARADELHDAARWAASQWAAVDCARVTFREMLASGAPAAPNDGRNTITFVDSGWMELGFAADAAATTDVRYRSMGDGAVEITEADIYLNAERFDFASDEPAAGERSLRATLLHELGHFLGLLHPCEPDGADGAPLCSSDHRDSVIFPLNDSSPRLTLSADEWLACVSCTTPSAAPKAPLSPSTGGVSRVPALTTTNAASACAASQAPAYPCHQPSATRVSAPLTAAWEPVALRATAPSAVFPRAPTGSLVTAANASPTAWPTARPAIGATSAGLGSA